MKLKRYNLGFGWFGPLEQCNDGKFMLAEDVEQHYTQQRKTWKELWFKAMDSLTEAESKADQWMYAALGASAAFLVELLYFMVFKGCK